MCELFGLSSAVPVGPQDILCRFGARGGHSADNRDGWGIAWHRAGGFAIEKEPQAAAASHLFGQLCTQARSSLFVAHVRKANPPTARTMANTHPFRRVCCGREWVFAHNGIIPETAMLTDPGTMPVCNPAGNTDSEHAFCVVLDSIATVLSSAHALPQPGWLDALARTAELLASHGRFNFLMSDGEHLIAYGHDRLHLLQDASRTCCHGVAAELAIIATEPLTPDDAWRAFAPGELRVFRAGREIAHFNTKPKSDTDGRAGGSTITTPVATEAAQNSAR